MTDEKKSLEEWMEEERKKLKKGFSYQPEPTSAKSQPSSVDQTVAGLGLGAMMASGAIAPHADSVTFEGCKADVIVQALKSEVADADTRIQVRKVKDSLVVTILQSQTHHPHRFSPALTVTLIESLDTLTVNVSNLNQEAQRNTLGSLGRTVLDQGRRLLFRRRGVRGLIDTAGNVIRGIENVTEDIQDLGLPKRVWAVIDRVGGAAEEAYLEEKRKQQMLQLKREAAERAWTHCEYCGRAYERQETELTNCPACGGPRGSKPAWLE